MGKIIFILGGARSGKSTFAVNLAKKISKEVLFLATAQPKDKEMQERIKLHRKNRPSSWPTIEEPFDILKVLSGPIKQKMIIIDCLTLYISNLLTMKQKNIKKAEINIINHILTLIKIIKNLKNKSCIIISNEVGLGIVPVNPLARYFRDIAGVVNQIVAKNSQQVYFLSAGIPLKIK